MRASPKEGSARHCSTKEGVETQSVAPERPSASNVAARLASAAASLAKHVSPRVRPQHMSVMLTSKEKGVRLNHTRPPKSGSWPSERGSSKA